MHSSGEATYGPIETLFRGQVHDQSQVAAPARSASEHTVMVRWNETLPRPKNTAPIDELRPKTTQQQREGCGWLAANCAELEALGLRDNDILALDLRVDRGADVWSLDAASVLGEAERLSPKRFNEMVRYFDLMGFPQSYGRPTLKQLLAGNKNEGPVYLYAVGDTTSSFGDRDFCHSLAGVSLSKLRKYRAQCHSAHALADAGLEKTDLKGGDVVRPDERFKCGMCGKRGTKMRCCAACGQVRYCDRTCQKMHWKDHKVACAKRQQAVKMCNDLGAKFAALRTGHDTVKRLSDAGVDEVLNSGKLELLHKEFNQFVEVAINTGMLANALWKEGGETSCRNIARYCIVDYGDFSEFLERYHSACSGNKGGCKFCKMIVYRSSDVDAMLGDERCLEAMTAHDLEGLKHVKGSLAEVDPQTHFLCCFTHRALGPLADKTVGVPWSSREKWGRSRSGA